MKHNLELNDEFEIECLFNIEVEHLNHISPNKNINDYRAESLSDKYLAVLDEKDRALLGIKKYFKSYSKEKCVPENREINNDAMSIFFQFSEDNKIDLHSWKISEKKDEFFVVYLGISAIKYCKEINWYSLNFSSTLDFFHNKFKLLKEERNDIFESFISDLCGKKRVYFSASNSYDLQLPRAEFNMGITDSHISQNPESIHIVQKYWSRSGMWFPVSHDFKRNFIEFIMLTFTLSQMELSHGNFIPILLDLENFDLRRRSIERKKNLLNKISMVVTAGKNYLDVHKEKKLTYFDLLYPARLVRVRNTKKEHEKIEYSEFTHFFSKDQEDKRKINDLLALINYNNAERMNYEIERKREFEEVRDLIESSIKNSMVKNISTGEN